MRVADSLTDILLKPTVRQEGWAEIKYLTRCGKTATELIFCRDL